MDVRRKGLPCRGGEGGRAKPGTKSGQRKRLLPEKDMFNALFVYNTYTLGFDLVFTHVLLWPPASSLARSFKLATTGKVKVAPPKRTRVLCGIVYRFFFFFSPPVRSEGEGVICPPLSFCHLRGRFPSLFVVAVLVLPPPPLPPRLSFSADGANIDKGARNGGNNHGSSSWWRR